MIDVSSLLRQGTYMLTTQAHKQLDDLELVEAGQLQLVRAPWKNNSIDWDD